MKRVGVIVLLIAASLMLMAQAPNKRTIEANEFLLRDSADKIRS